MGNNLCTSQPCVAVISHPGVVVDSHPGAVVDSHPGAVVDSHPGAVVVSHPGAVVVSRGACPQQEVGHIFHSREQLQDYHTIFQSIAVSNYIYNNYSIFCILNQCEAKGPQKFYTSKVFVTRNMPKTCCIFNYISVGVHLQQQVRVHVFTCREEL